ncbi:pre-tRNA nuclear export protein [Rhizophlyctis rosea]|nr:pre-tRNA nuclear export protein [Rhizophlyctis rosea]
MQLGYVVRAVGGVAKGFPDYRTIRTQYPTPAAQPYYSPPLRASLSLIIRILSQLNSSEIIRDACRYTFQRMVGSLGPGVMEYVRPLLGAGIFAPEGGGAEGGGRREVVEFLGVLGVVVHRFGMDLTPILNDLLPPLLDKIFEYLAVPAEGTDDVRECVELRKGYLGFLGGLFVGGVDGVLVSEVNMPRLGTITESILAYASDSTYPEVQKAAFGLLAKMVTYWGGVAPRPVPPPKVPQQQQQPHANGVNGTSGKKKGMVGAAAGGGKASPPITPTPTPPPTTQPSSTTPQPPKIPTFQPFITQTLIPLLFSVPLQPQFNLSDPAYAAVVGEIGGCHKAVWVALGEGYGEFLRGVVWGGWRV